MIVHRLHFVGRGKRSKGYAFDLNEFLARPASKEPPCGTVEVEQDSMDVHLNKQGVFDLLRQWCQPCKQQVKRQ